MDNKSVKASLSIRLKAPISVIIFDQLLTYLQNIFIRCIRGDEITILALLE